MHDGLINEVNEILTGANTLLGQSNALPPMPVPVYFMENGNVLCLPRSQGDSRYVYGDNGFNFWLHASGYMYANIGLFSLFTRRKEGEEPVIAFFAGVREDEESFRRISLLPVPVCEDGEALVVRRFTVLNNVAGYFITETKRFTSCVRVTVDESNNIVFSVYLRNDSPSTVDLMLSSYFRPFCRHQLHESDEDRWFSEMTYEPDVDSLGNFAAAALEIAEDTDRFHSETYYAALRGRRTAIDSASFAGRSTTTSRVGYTGDIKRNLASALSLRRGSFASQKSITTFNDITVAGDLNTVRIDAGGAVRFDYMFQRVPTRDGLARITATPLATKAIDQVINKARKMNGAISASLKAEVGNFEDNQTISAQQFNPFVEHLKHQVSVCGLLKGYMQLAPNSLIGIRDVFQALEGLLYYRPVESRAKMIEALGFTTPTGRCLRQYSLPPVGAKAGRADLRPFIDQGVWIVNAVYTYLCHSGDYAFLEQEAGYHIIADESAGVILPGDERDSVLLHLFRIMDYLNSHRDHQTTKLLCALYGDWNDALDGLGISLNPDKLFGTGVSVMASLQLFQNCHEMIELLEAVYPGEHKDRVETYGRMADELAENLIAHAVISDKAGNRRIVHGWGDQKSYLVGSYEDPDGASRDGLTGNAFWVISGMLRSSPDLESTVINSFQRLDAKYGLLTFNPAFPKDTKGVGRIPKLPPGTAENGATYIHATLFGIWAYFLMGKPRDAWQQIEKILPFTPIHEHYTHSPFVMPNSYVHNPELGLDGESMNDWQTGSSNVLLKVLLWFVFGYRPTFEGIRVQVANWTPVDTFSFSITVPRHDGMTLSFRYRKEKNLDVNRVFYVNGKGPLSGTFDPHLKCEVYFLPYTDFTADTEVEIVDRIPS